MNVNFVFSDLFGQAGELEKILILLMVVIYFLLRYFLMRKKYKFSRMKDIQARWDSMSGDDFARKQEFCKDRFGRFFNKNEYMFFKKMDNDPSVIEFYAKSWRWFKVGDDSLLQFDQVYMLYYSIIAVLCMGLYWCFISVPLFHPLGIAFKNYHTIGELLIIILWCGVLLLGPFITFFAFNELGKYNQKILGFWKAVPDEHKKQNSRPFDLYDGLRFIKKQLMDRFRRGLVRRDSYQK